MTTGGARWAEALYPQHTKSSGAAAVLAAADTAQAVMRRRNTAERDAQVCDELDRIDEADEQEDT